MGAAMRIVRIEDLHCDAGWRVRSFLKVTTDDKRSGRGRMAGEVGAARELPRG